MSKLTDAEKAEAQRIALVITVEAGNGLRAAKKYGFSEPSLWSWRNGRKSPTRENFEKLKKILKGRGNDLSV